MSFNSIKSKTQSGRGFTIVELLIVIVVIGILAAITIVAYNGVTARANTTSAKSAANSFAKKAEIYNADGGTNKYPNTAAQLTGAASTSTWYLSGVTVNVSTTALTSSSSNSSIRVLKCSSAVISGTNNQAAITDVSTGNAAISGLTVYWFDYSAGTETTTPLLVGNTTNCPTT